MEAAFRDGCNERILYAFQKCVRVVGGIFIGLTLFDVSARGFSWRSWAEGLFLDTLDDVFVPHDRADQREAKVVRDGAGGMSVYSWSYCVFMELLITYFCVNKKYHTAQVMSSF